MALWKSSRPGVQGGAPGGGRPGGSVPGSGAWAARGRNRSYGRIESTGAAQSTRTSSIGGAFQLDSTKWPSR